MGIDVYYYAMPDECELFKLAKEDSQYSLWITTNIQMEIDFVENYSDQELTPKDLKVLQAAKKLLKSNPGIESRNFETRFWDKFLWLLSEQRRRPLWNSQMNDVWKRIIIGGDYIYDEDQGKDSQVPLFLTATEVKTLAQKLMSVTSDDLRKFYNPQMMHEHVYKYFLRDNPEQEFQAILEEFEDFRSFYQTVARNDEGIVSELH